MKLNVLLLIAYGLMLLRCSSEIAGGSSSEVVVATVRFSPDSVIVTASGDVRVTIHNATYLAFERVGFTSRGQTDQNGRYAIARSDTEFCTVTLEDSLYRNSACIFQRAEDESAIDTLRPSGTIGGTLPAEGPDERFFVALPGTDLATMTDEFGNLLLTGVPSGTKTLVIQPFRFLLDSGPDPQLSIELLPGRTDTTILVETGGVSSLSP